eukprot:4414142-Prorocentrum_lima.AAC.1
MPPADQLRTFRPPGRRNWRHFQVSNPRVAAAHVIPGEGDKGLPGRPEGLVDRRPGKRAGTEIPCKPLQLY